MQDRYIDPFGAPEFFCSDARYEMMASGIVRVVMVAPEEGETLVKVKLLMPLASVTTCIASAMTFTASQAVKSFAHPLLMM